MRGLVGGVAPRELDRAKTTTITGARRDIQWAACDSSLGGTLHALAALRGADRRRIASRRSALTRSAEALRSDVAQRRGANSYGQLSRSPAGGTSLPTLRAPTSAGFDQLTVGGMHGCMTLVAEVREVEVGLGVSARRGSAWRATQWWTTSAASSIPPRRERPFPRADRRRLQSQAACSTRFAGVEYGACAHQLRSVSRWQSPWRRRWDATRLEVIPPTHPTWST